MASGTPLAVGALLTISVACGPDAVLESTENQAASPVSAEVAEAESHNAPQATLSPSPSNEGAPPTQEAFVPEVRDWSADLVGGGRIDLAELGERPILLWFWAPY